MKDNDRMYAPTVGNAQIEMETCAKTTTVARTVSMVHGPLPFRLRYAKVVSVPKVPKRPRQGAQCDERQHGIHDRTLKEPDTQTGDQTGPKHALDGGHREAHVSSQEHGVLQFSQRGISGVPMKRVRVVKATH